MNPKNIIFDLGGVVFSRDHSKCNPEFLKFFSFVAKNGTPPFWDEYDRGALSYDEVKVEVCRFRNCDADTCEAMLREAISTQQEVASTKELITDLKRAGYNLYVLSNMSLEFIEFLRRLPVYELFDGEVVSCEVKTIKPEPEIYLHLISKYNLDPSQSLFIDDRPVNLEGASVFGFDTCLFDNRNPEKTCAELRARLL